MVFFESFNRVLEYEFEVDIVPGGYSAENRFVLFGYTANAAESSFPTVLIIGFEMERNKILKVGFQEFANARIV